MLSIDSRFSGTSSSSATWICVRVLEPADELEDAGRVDDPGFDQRLVPRQAAWVVAEEEVGRQKPPQVSLHSAIVSDALAAPARTLRQADGGSTVMRMCGLAGIYGRREQVSRELLLDMAGELRHRGPDGVGLYLDGRFGMTNTRLAIVDLDSGDQPISDERGRFWVMQNGEIYNYVELREELEALGHGFSTESDTEVIAHAYEEWGVELPPASERRLRARDLGSGAPGALPGAGSVRGAPALPRLVRRRSLLRVRGQGAAPTSGRAAGARSRRHRRRLHPLVDAARSLDLRRDPGAARSALPRRRRRRSAASAFAGGISTSPREHARRAGGGRRSSTSCTRSSTTRFESGCAPTSRSRPT